MGSCKWNLLLLPKCIINGTVRDFSEINFGIFLYKEAASFSLRPFLTWNITVPFNFWFANILCVALISFVRCLTVVKSPSTIWSCVKRPVWMEFLVDGRALRFLLEKRPAFHFLECSVLPTWALNFLPNLIFRQHL